MFGIQKTINHDVSAGGLTSWPWGRLGSPGLKKNGTFYAIPTVK
jgi:hypothetical protein